MKNEEDEAFDELARRQGAWGGGYQAKRQAAMDKINSHFDAAYKKMHEDRAMYSDIVSDGGLDPRNKMDAQPAHCQCTACKDGVIHASDCAVHNGPAYPAGPCDCGAMSDRQRLEAIVSVINKYLPPFGMHIMDAMSAIISLVDPLPPATQPVQPMQESVAHVYLFDHAGRPRVAWDNAKGIQIGDKLYTKPPKRPWVGLTDEDRKAALLAAYKEWECEELLLCAREDYLLIEQALKEKNDG